MLPVAEGGKKALGSMGNNAPIAAMAMQPCITYDYFRQLFTQVTNPPHRSTMREYRHITWSIHQAQGQSSGDEATTIPPQSSSFPVNVYQGNECNEKPEGHLHYLV